MRRWLIRATVARMPRSKPSFTASFRREGGTPMAIRIKTDFGSLTNNELWNRGMVVFLALSGSLKYSNPPMAMVMLKSLLDAFHAAIVDAMDGGKMARTTR